MASDQVRDALANGVRLIRVLLIRWHVEKWFERAKQEAGLGAYEVRTYKSLTRHWLCVRLATCFLSEQTARLRREKCTDHVRASVRGRLDAGGEALGARLAELVGADPTMCLPPAT